MKKIVFEGHEIAYRTKGEPSQPAVLLLHGNSCGAEMFHPQLTGFFKEYFVVAPDFYGHGSSGRPSEAGAYSIQGLGKPVIALVRHLKIEQLIIYGVSLGGHVAIEIAPLLVPLKGVMVSGSPPFALPLNLGNCFVDSPVMTKALDAELDQQEIKAWADACIYDNSEAKELVMKLIEGTYPQFRPNFGQTVATSSGLSDERKLIENFDFPVAILQGEHEWLINNDYMRQMKPKDLYNDEVVVIPNSQHFPSLEHPSAFNEVLRNFAEYCFS